MHEKAAARNRQYGNTVSRHVVEDGKFIPVHRPCDWCGRVVEKGFIHAECRRRETALIQDIMDGC